MTPSDLEELRRLMQVDDATEIAAPIFVSLDAERLASLKSKDEHTWTVVAAKSCEWAHGGFDFEFCDVLVSKLEAIFLLGDLDLKAAALVAAAALGADHNRFYVMGRVQELCGRSLDDLVARRIAVEIVAADAYDDFIRCAAHGGSDQKVYHRVIRALLDEHLARRPARAAEFPDDMPF